MQFPIASLCKNLNRHDVTSLCKNLVKIKKTNFLRAAIKEPKFCVDRKQATSVAMGKVLASAQKISFLSNPATPLHKALAAPKRFTGIDIDKLLYQSALRVIVIAGPLSGLWSRPLVLDCLFSVATGLPPTPPHLALFPPLSKLVQIPVRRQYLYLYRYPNRHKQKRTRQRAPAPWVIGFEWQWRYGFGVKALSC
jgi:hypothetical protein